MIEKLEHRWADGFSACGGASYEETIDKINEIIDVLNGKEEPELRESEDERMVREFNDYLCEEIECRTNDLRDEKDRRTLNMLCYVLGKVKDWLERQKEQKPYGQRDECKDCQANYAGMCKGSCEMKRKEQKPADYDHEMCKKQEWSEDEIHRKWILEYLYDGLRKADEQFKDHFKSAIDWFEKQKPAEKSEIPTNPEWSEEDIEMYINIASSLHGYACGLENEEHKKHIKKGLDWLENRFRSLRPQVLPEDTVIFQKGVAEGRRLEREEQEKADDGDKRVLVFDPIAGTELWKAIHLSLIVARGKKERILLLFNGRYIPIEPGDKTEDIQRLYFCHWKPTEEQMKILKAVEDYVAQVSGYWEQGLDSLYNDLQTKL